MNRHCDVVGWLTVGVILAAVATAAEPLAGWRGDGTGRFPAATPPLSWSADSNVVWKTALPGLSNASVVPAADSLFVCSEPATLLCVSATDGAIRWERPNTYADVMAAEQEGGTLPERPGTHATNGYSSPTPVTDGRYVYALFGNGVAACYAIDGTRQWARLVRQPTHEWGHSASPVLVEGKLILHIEGVVTAVEPLDGTTIWSTPGASQWGTPAVLHVGGQAVIATACGDMLRVADGKVVASGLGKMPWGCPYAFGNVVYMIDENGARALKVPAEMSDTLEVETLWEIQLQKGRYYASPVYHEGLIYAIHFEGMLSVVEADTGERVYAQPVSPGGTVYPSICLVGDKLLVSGDAGGTVVVEPGREYREIGRNSLEPFRSTPIPVGSRLYIRGLSHLYCIGG